MRLREGLEAPRIGGLGQGSGNRSMGIRQRFHHQLVEPVSLGLQMDICNRFMLGNTDLIPAK